MASGSSEIPGSHVIRVLPRAKPLGPYDEWLDVKDPAERRKRQNRLHQRALRQRRALQRQEARETQGVVFVFEHCSAPLSHGHGENGEVVDPLSLQDVGLSPLFPISLSALSRHIERVHVSQHTVVVDTTISKPKLIPPVILYLDNPYDLPRPLVFPLAADHRLITLVQYNVLRATLTNMAILSILNTMPTECRADSAVPAHLLFDLPNRVPPSLQATALQQSIAHEPWIDAVPIPAMRDNLILNYDSIDQDDLCCDLLGGLYEGFDDVALTGVIVWRQPWHVDGWEVSEGFAQKWGFLLKGCTELIESTNRWREIRGEDRLVVEV